MSEYDLLLATTEAEVTRLNPGDAPGHISVRQYYKALQVPVISNP